MATASQRLMDLHQIPWIDAVERMKGTAIESQLGKLIAQRGRRYGLRCGLKVWNSIKARVQTVHYGPVDAINSHSPPAGSRSTRT